MLNVSYIPQNTLFGEKKEKYPIVREENFRFVSGLKETKRNSTLLPIDSLPTENELSELNFELEAQNAVENKDGSLTLIYSFSFRKKDYTFAITQMADADRYNKKTYSLNGFILGKLMPIDVQIFDVPQLATCKAKNFESAECTFFDKIYDLIEEGKIGETSALKVQYKEICYDKNGSLAFKRNDLYQAENIRIADSSFKSEVEKCLISDDFEAYKKKVGEVFVNDIANRLIRSWYKMRDNFHCNIQKTLLKETELNQLAVTNTGEINGKIIPVMDKQTRAKNRLIRNKRKKASKDYASLLF